MTNKQIRDLLVKTGGTPGPINDTNRKLYVELLVQHQRGEVSKTVAARRLSKDQTPVMSSTRIDRPDTTRPIITGAGVTTLPHMSHSARYTVTEGG